MDKKTQELFSEIVNPRLRRAFETDIREFMQMIGIEKAESFRSITRAHIMNYKNQLEQRRLDPLSIKRKLSSLREIFDFLVEKEVVSHNPVKGFK